MKRYISTYFCTINIYQKKKNVDVNILRCCVNERSQQLQKGDYKMSLIKSIDDSWVKTKILYRLKGDMTAFPDGHTPAHEFRVRFDDAPGKTNGEILVYRRDLCEEGRIQRLMAPESETLRNYGYYWHPAFVSLCTNHNIHECLEISELHMTLDTRPRPDSKVISFTSEMYKQHCDHCGSEVNEHIIHLIDAINGYCRQTPIDNGLVRRATYVLDLLQYGFVKKIFPHMFPLFQTKEHDGQECVGIGYQMAEYMMISGS